MGTIGQHHPFPMLLKKLIKAKTKYLIKSECSIRICSNSVYFHKPML